MWLPLDGVVAGRFFDFPGRTCPTDEFVQKVPIDLLRFLGNHPVGQFYVGATIMKSTFCISLTVAGCALVIWTLPIYPVQANSLTWSYSIQYSGIPGALSTNGSTPESGSFTWLQGTEQGNASAATTAVPSATANITSGGCTSGFPGSGCAGGNYQITSTVTYQIEVTAPTSTSVLYDFATAGQITATAPFPSGYGTADVHVFVNQGNTLQVGTILEQSGQTACYGGGCINGTYQVSLNTNQIYTVSVVASALAFTNFAETTDAFADPYIFIDSSVINPNQYTLLIADGVGNAPLSAVPGPVVGAGLPGAILAFGGLLGWMRRRRAALAA